MSRPRFAIPPQVTDLSIQDKLKLIYALLDDLTAELIEKYPNVDVEFRVKAN